MKVEEVDLTDARQVGMLREAVSTGLIRSLAGQVICFTGKMAMPRLQMQLLAEALGARTSLSVDRTTTLLVTANVQTMSSKTMQAREHGVKIVSEREFTEMMSLKRV